MNSLRLYCENNPKIPSTWILLYCLYKQTNYVPGQEYCRWKYENLYTDDDIPDMEYIPKARWSIYMPYCIDFKSVKAQHFYKVVNLYLKLALYEFAEWIYNEIAVEALDIEKYFMANTFKILLNKLEKKFSMKTYPVEKYLNPICMVSYRFVTFCGSKGCMFLYFQRATLSQVNGNLEYFRNGSTGSAMEYYSHIGDIQDLTSIASYSLAFLRYAYHLLDEKNYSKAKEIFFRCCNTEDVGVDIIAAIGRGNACFRVSELSFGIKFSVDKRMNDLQS